jgi:hypothetical protein
LCSEASTSEIHLSDAKSPTYVTTAAPATCGSVFVAAATFVLVIVRTGKLGLDVPYLMLVIFEIVKRIPLSAHDADVVPSPSV